MHPHRSIIGVLAVVLIGISSLAGVVYAGENGNTLRPVIPMGQGDACVEDTDFMRRNHMELLKHQRDETMLNGVRGLRAGCHTGDGGKSVTFLSFLPRLCRCEYRLFPMPCITS